VNTQLGNAIHDFFLDFASILYEALPFVVLGALIAGFLEELVPQTLLTTQLPRFRDWLNRSLSRVGPLGRLLAILVDLVFRSRYVAIGLGGLLGIIFPMCECGIIPVMRRLLRKGVPLSCCVAYLLCGPVINVVVLGSTYTAFFRYANEPGQLGGWGMVLCRAGFAYLIAFTTAVLVDRMYAKHGNVLLKPLAAADTASKDNADIVAKPRPLGRRLAAISETALSDFIDITVFLILGAVLSAIIARLIPEETIAAWSQNQPIIAILAMMAMAILLCLCSEADAFVAASFRTLPASSKVAFLVLGPMLDLKLYLMYTRIFRAKLRHSIFASVIVQTLIYSYIFHLIWTAYHGAPIGTTPVR
jgi:uncharacterized membrane protein YraQ (UPF0718 family)